MKTATMSREQERILDAACHEVVASIRLGIRVGRVVPRALLAERLAIAANEAALRTDA